MNRRKIIMTLRREPDLVFTLWKRKRLDIIIAEKVKTVILRTVDVRYKNIILDLQHVDFMDSTAVAMLIDLNRSLNKTGQRLKLANISGDMMELIGLVPLLKDLVEEPTGSDTPTLAA